MSQNWYFLDSSFNTSQESKENNIFYTHSSNISSDESEPIDSDEEEAENEDVVKFLTGNSSTTNGNKKSPNCPNSGGSYLEVKKVFQNLGLSPTKFLENSPIKSTKNIDKLTTLKTFTCPASATESHHRDKGRDVPISKTRLTYGMEIDDGSTKNDLASPSNQSVNKSSKSNSRDSEIVKVTTKEIYQTTKPRQIDPVDRNISSSHVTLSGNTKIKISSSNISKSRDISNSVTSIGRKMDKSSSSGGTTGTAGSSNQNSSAGEKRPLPSTNPAQDQHLEDNDDETKRKKQKISSSSGASSSSKEGSGKEDTNIGKDGSNLSNTTSTTSTGGVGGNGSTLGKGGRSTRGSSSEKSAGMGML